MIELRVLGALELHADDGRELHSLLAQPKRVALLTYLCVATPRGFHRRDALLGLFWPEASGEHARSSLRNALYVLRRALGEGAIVTRGTDDVRVDARVVACDAVTFADAVKQGAVEDAVRLYGGDFLPGFFVHDVPSFERWVEVERARMRDDAVRAARLFADRLASGGNWSGAVRAARHAVELGDSGEREIRRLIELLWQLGDRGGALQVYETFSQRLLAEYQTVPAPETQKLIARIRSEQLTPTVRPGPVARSQPWSVGRLT